MKTAISIPDPVFQQAEELARRLAVSRSELYTTAIAAYLEAHLAADVTAKLNEVYGKNESSLDPAFLKAQAAVLSEERW